MVISLELNEIKMEIFVQFTILRKSFTLTLEFKRLDGGLAEAWLWPGGSLTEFDCVFLEPF